MSRSRVDQSHEGFIDEVGGECYSRGKGVGMSGSVEMDLSRTNGVNAVLITCGGRTADYFFESVTAGGASDFASVFAERPLDARDLLHSFATWPGFAQNMHRLLSKRRCRSC